MQELQRRNDQIDTLVSQPFYQLPQLDQPNPIAESTPEKKSTEIDQYNLDQGLNTTDIENLENMDFELPNVGFNANKNKETIEKIVTKTSLGHKLGKGATGKQTSDRDRQIYESQQETVYKYQEILKRSESVKTFKVKPKTGEGLKNKKKRQDSVDLIV